MCSERDILMCHVSGTVHMSKLCYVDTPGEWRIRIRHVSDTDTPWIRFQPYPKKMDTYWLRYVYPTRMGHVFERETMGRERREREEAARLRVSRWRAVGRPRRRGMQTEELGAVEDWRQGMARGWVQRQDDGA